MTPAREDQPTGRKLGPRERIDGGGASRLVELHGPELGKTFVLDDEEFTIGRGARNNVIVEFDNVSRRHARIATRQGRSFVADLGSTNGTYLNDEEVLEETPLRGGDLMKVGGAIFKFLSGGNVEALFHEEMYRLATLDTLTSARDRRFLWGFLERATRRCLSLDQALSVVLFEADAFRTTVGADGRPARDYVLRELADLVRPRVRDEECFARHFGERFAVVLPGAGSDNAHLFAEKFRILVEEHAFAFQGRDLPVTASVGVVDLAAGMTEPAQLMKVAEANLLRAQRAGGNQVR
jgi:diguanylate cyclase (GGDEF)-like protein